MAYTCFIQLSRKAYDILRDDGVLYCDKNHFCKAEDRKGWMVAYRWMMKKMIEHGISRPSDKHYPLWCWVQRNSPRGISNVDITLCKNHVLVKFEIAQRDILLSDFGLWHIVLNQGYIGKNYEEFLDRPNTPYKRKAIRKSWNNCLLGDASNGYYDEDMDFTSYEVTQGVFFELNMRNVTGVLEI